MGIIGNKKKIMLKNVNDEGWTIQAFGEVETIEVCSALLGALCTSAQILTVTQDLPPDAVKQMINKELDLYLGEDALSIVREEMLKG